MTIHLLSTRTENLGQRHEFTVNTPVPHTGLLPVVHLLLLSRVQAKTAALGTGISSAILLAEVRFSSRLYHLRQRPCFCGTLFLQIFPHLSWELISSCISFKLILTALGSCPIPPFWQDISFAFSTSPSPLETVEAVSGCRWAKQTCQEKLLCWCIAGAHIVRFSSPERYCVPGAKSK